MIRSEDWFVRVSSSAVQPDVVYIINKKEGINVRDDKFESEDR